MIVKSEIPFVRLLFPFLIGLVVAYFYPSEITIILSLVIIVTCLLSLLFINHYYKTLKAYNYKGLIGSFISILFFLLGSINCLLHNQSLKPNFFALKDDQYLKVWIATEPEQKGNILRFECEVTQTIKDAGFSPATGKLLIALKLDQLDARQLAYGDELLILAKYVPVEEAYNPAEFDFRQWLATKNIYHQAFINEQHLIRLNSNAGNILKKYAIKIRQKQIAIYQKLIKNKEALAVASTLVLGYRSDLSKETLSAYSKTGTIHALSVSGMHVGLIYLLLNWLLFFLDRNKYLKWVKLILISISIWYYALLTGLAPSVLRSAVMLSVFVIAKAFNKNTNNYNIMAFTAFCLLVYDPYLIWNVGFQLSFLAVFGLIYLQPKIYSWLYIPNKWLDKIWNIVAISLAAQLATFPLSIYYFHQFPLYFIFSNLFIVLPITAIMYLGIIILVLRLYVIAEIFEWLIMFTNNTLKWIAHLPYAGINGIWINQWQLLLLSIALVCLILALVNYNKRLLLFTITLFIVFQIEHFRQTVVFSQQRKMIFYSLRKNYAAAFIYGGKAILITDLTTNDQNYDFFVKPSLEQLQIKQIEIINWDQDLTKAYFIKKDHQILFFNHHILLMDQTFNFTKINNPLQFNTVWIHQNPKINVQTLATDINFKTLLIDATNKDYQIKKRLNEAKKTTLFYQILKKNKAYLVDLN